MPLPKACLAAKLVEPLPTTDDGVLRTIGDAVAYRTGMSKHREVKQAWQHACRLILSRADAEAITHQLSLTPFMDSKLDLGQKRARAKALA